MACVDESAHACLWYNMEKSTKSLDFIAKMVLTGILHILEETTGQG